MNNLLSLDRLYEDSYLEICIGIDDTFNYDNMKYHIGILDVDLQRVYTKNNKPMSFMQFNTLSSTVYYMEHNMSLEDQQNKLEELRKCISIDKWSYFSTIQDRAIDNVHKLLNGITIDDRLDDRILGISYISSPDSLKEIIDSSVNRFMGLQLYIFICMYIIISLVSIWFLTFSITSIYIFAFSIMISFFVSFGIWDPSNGLLKYCMNFPIDKLSRQKKYEMIRQLQSSAVKLGDRCLTSMAYHNSTHFMNILKNGLENH